ncbi:MAG: bifunctional DNA-formamidopyrimidine glycosylase/DNA-(apurinic or apyrimidinic site) lyase [Actinomycetota bacterium]
MPELPEVETVRRGLEPWVVGRKIKSIEMLGNGGYRSTTYAPFSALEGAKVVSMNRRGKFLWFEVTRNLALVAHLGMSGQFIIQEKKAPDEKHLRARIDCGDRRRELRFIDQRTFGWLAIDQLVFEDGVEVPTSFQRIARDIFDPKFDSEKVISKILKKKSAIKRVLLDQKVMSGVGNIYADEALWLAKIHPERIAQALHREEVEELLKAVKKVMSAALKQGGTSFDDLYINVNGESGYFDVELEAYAQDGEPCSRCGSEIRRISFGNRSSHFCPLCQPKRARKKVGSKRVK